MKVNRYIYIIASHVYFASADKENFGPAHTLNQYLKKKRRKVFFIKHDLLARLKKDDLSDEELFVNPSKKDLAIKSLREIIHNLYFVLSQKIKSNDAIVYVGVDPINSFPGAILRYLQVIHKNIYYTPDYADKRFSNFFINAIYHFLDKFCLAAADDNWSVSTRIAKKRKAQGVPDRKNNIVPNSPDFYSIHRKKYNGNKDLVIVSYLGERLRLNLILKVFLNLSKKYPDVRLQIIGSGPKENYFKGLVKKTKLEKHVYFVGQKSHEEAIDILTNSFIGIAFYEANTENIYGDSMKVREYVASGIPVIINDVPATADDVQRYNAGVVIKNDDTKPMENFISRCIEDRPYYMKLRKNAMKMGKDFDKYSILGKILQV